jgi:hypothetical protein
MEQKTHSKRVAHGRGGAGALSLTPYFALTLLLLTSVSAQAAGGATPERGRPAFNLLSQILGVARLNPPSATEAMLKPAPRTGSAGADRGVYAWLESALAISMADQGRASRNHEDPPGGAGHTPGPQSPRGP